MKKNTYKNGVLTFLSYKTSEGAYVVACNELCILREGKDLELTKLQILKDAKSYIKNVRDNKLGPHLFNQKLPEEILNEFTEYVKESLKGYLLDEFEKWHEQISNLLEDKKIKT